jgi:hypothetical protein
MRQPGREEVELGVCHTQFCKQNQVLIACVSRIIYSTHGPKVFIDNQMSQIKYIYYINNVPKD